MSLRLAFLSPSSAPMTSRSPHWPLLNCDPFGSLGILPGPGFLSQDDLPYFIDMHTCPHLYLTSPSPYSPGLICSHLRKVFLPQMEGRWIQIVTFQILEPGSEPQTLDLRPRLGLLYF